MISISIDSFISCVAHLTTQRPEYIATKNVHYSINIEYKIKYALLQYFVQLTYMFLSTGNFNHCMRNKRSSVC